MKNLLLLTGVLIASINSYAATYYVSQNGNNSNNGLSSATAFATIQHASELIVAGDSVIVMPGTYQGFDFMNVNGTLSNPVVFLASSTGVIIDSPCSYNNADGINIENADYVIVKGFHVEGMPRAGIRVALSSHVTISNNKCTDNFKWGIFTGFADYITIENNECSYSADEHGIYHSNSADHAIIRNNISHHNNRCGIHMNGDVSMGGDGVLSDAKVYGNIIYENGAAGGSGINCDGVVNSQIFNNLLYENHASGISLYQIDAGAPSTGNKVYNNTVVNASNGRWCLNITDDCTANEVLNNIFINKHSWRGSIVIAASALQGFVSDYNILTNVLSPDGDATILNLNQWHGLGYDLHSTVAGPVNSIFLNPAAANFHPLNSTAAMIDAGSSAVSSIVTIDLDGNSRPSGVGYDIGAYEWQTLSGVSEFENQEVLKVHDRGTELVVTGMNAGDHFVLCDMNGKLITSADVQGFQLVLQKQHLPSGISMLRVNSKKRIHYKSVKLLNL
jgi:parallel beta-helix repeat protein